MISPTPHLQATTLFNLEFFFELSPDFMCIAGFDGHFKKINAAVIDILGYSEQELLDKPVLNFVHPEDRELTIEKRRMLFDSSILTQFENRYIHKDGSIIWLQWSSIAIKEEELVYATAKDITAKKTIEVQRDNLLRNMSEVNRELKVFNYNTSHDLRSPLSNLLALHELIDEKSIEDEELAEYIDLLKLATQNLNQIICKTMDDWIKRDQKSIQIKKINIGKSLEQTCNSIQQLLVMNGVTIHSNFDDAPYVNFSPEYLQSILLNLLTNSIKYARPEIPPIITLKSTIESNKVVLTYTDNGMGIDLKKAEGRIFKLHQRFQESDSNSKGIGLYLIHNHINSLGGAVSVYSKPNKGTTFRLEFKNLK